MAERKQEQGTIGPVSKGLILAMLAVSCMAAYWLGTKSRDSLKSRGGLVVRDEHLDFGEVWESEKFAWSIPIVNTAGQAIQLKDISATCSCLSIEPKTLVIPSGGTGEIHLVIDTRGPVHEQDHKLIHGFATKVTATIEGEVERAVWTIHGKIRRVLGVSARSIEFGETLVRGSHFPSRTIEVTALVPVKTIRAKCNSAVLLSRVERIGKEPDRFRVEVAFQDSLEAKHYESVVDLEPESPSGEKLPAAPIRVRGRVLDDIQAFPSSIMFSPGLVGSVATRSVTIGSTSGKPFSLESLAFDSPDITLRQHRSEKSESQVIEIRLRIKREGHQSTIVRFHVRDQKGESFTIPIEVFWYGEPTKLTAAKTNTRDGK